jgi:hypothetical protein
MDVTEHKVDNSWAWLLAATPLLFLCVDAALLWSGYALPVVSLVVSLAALIGLLVVDQAALKRAGAEVGAAWGFFIPPVYLGLRARRTDQSFGPLAAWIAAFVVSLAGSALLYSAFAQLDANRVEAFVKEQADAYYGKAQDVECPDREVYRVGSRFSCDVTDSEGTALLTVSVEDSAGTIRIVSAG